MSAEKSSTSERSTVGRNTLAVSTLCPWSRRVRNSLMTSRSGASGMTTPCSSM